MQEVFEKFIKKLEAKQDKADEKCKDIAIKDGHSLEYEFYNGMSISYMHAIEIVKQEAEKYNNGWFPCSERLPDEYGDYLVAWKPLHMSAEDIIRKVGRAIPHYYEIVEYDPDDEELWIGSIEQAQGEYEIIAWQPLPDPYQPKGE